MSMPLLSPAGAEPRAGQVHTRGSFGPDLVKCGQSSSSPNGSSVKTKVVKVPPTEVFVKIKRGPTSGRLTDSECLVTTGH